MIEHVYFLLDETKNRIRIGKCDNLLRRVLDHQKDNGHRLKVLGVTEGGYEREQEIQAMFEPLRLPCESSRGRPVLGASDDWFLDTPELREWIAANTKPWDRSDTFNLQSNIPGPTLAMHGSAEWMAWFERFAEVKGVMPGTLVDLALAVLAEKENYQPPPPR
jgi:hypothetical protein